MFNVRLAGSHLYGKQMFTWLSLVVSLMASFVLPFFPLDDLGEIWDSFESVSEGFLIYSFFVIWKSFLVLGVTSIYPYFCTEIHLANCVDPDQMMPRLALS